MSPIERELLQSLYDDLSSFLLDNVNDDETWEDTFPRLDQLRTHIGDLLLGQEGELE